MKKYLFRNDYSFGAHPKVLEAVCAVNLEGNHGYGDDGYTARAKERIREVCGCPDAMVEFLIGGTQTNVVACSFLLKPWEAAICPDSGHLNGHEVGAFEATGHRILPVPVGGDSRITPEMLPPLLALHQDPHLTKPGLVYISNATENGAVYTKAELTALYAFCRENGLLLFVDGARLGAALTSKANNLTLPEFAHLCDAFYIGGTKNGAMFGEALVITRPELTDGFFRMKKRMGAVMEKGWTSGRHVPGPVHRRPLLPHGPPRQRNGRPPPGRAEGQGVDAVGGLPHQPGVRRGGQRPQAPARRGVRLRGLVPL